MGKLQFFSKRNELPVEKLVTRFWPELEMSWWGKFKKGTGWKVRILTPRVDDKAVEHVWLVFSLRWRYQSRVFLYLWNHCIYEANDIIDSLPLQLVSFKFIQPHGTWGKRKLSYPLPFIRQALQKMLLGIAEMLLGIHLSASFLLQCGSENATIYVMEDPRSLTDLVIFCNHCSQLLNLSISFHSVSSMG